MAWEGRGVGFRQSVVSQRCSNVQRSLSLMTICIIFYSCRQFSKLHELFIKRLRYKRREGGVGRGRRREKWGRGSCNDVLTKCFVRYVNIANVYKNMQKRGVQKIAKDLFDK